MGDATDITFFLTGAIRIQEHVIGVSIPLHAQLGVPQQMPHGHTGILWRAFPQSRIRILLYVLLPYSAGSAEAAPLGSRSVWRISRVDTTDGQRYSDWRTYTCMINFPPKHLERG